VDKEDLIYRLRKRAEIRRQISTRKSVQEGAPDRIADLLEEAADALEKWWCDWFHSGQIKRHYYTDLINWQCSKCGRWSDE
jgi:hypothetical protein